MKLWYEVYLAINPQVLMGYWRMKKLKVLVVDDESEFVSALAERLTLRGFDVGTALSGDEALRIIDADPPRVLVLDAMMPGTKGVDVLKRLRLEHPEIQVILITGNVSFAAEPIATELGAFDCLLKPVSIDALVKTLKQAAQQPAT